MFRVRVRKTKSERMKQMRVLAGKMRDELMGVAKIKMIEPLSDLEIQELKNYCRGPLSDGWDESFEQREIDTMNGEIYVHF